MFRTPGGRLWFAAEWTNEGKLLPGNLFLVLLVYRFFVLLVTSQANFIAATSLIIRFGLYARKRHKADGAVLGRRKRCEEVGALEILPEFLHQRIEPLADILRRELLGLARLILLALFTHGGGNIEAQDENVRLLVGNTVELLLWYFVRLIYDGSE